MKCMSGAMKNLLTQPFRRPGRYERGDADHWVSPISFLWAQVSVSLTSARVSVQPHYPDLAEDRTGCVWSAAGNMGQGGHVQPLSQRARLRPTAHEIPPSASAR